MKRILLFCLAAAGLLYLWQPGGDSMQLEKAIFAGGCFWCMEPPFEKVAGVSEVISGYTGGTTVNPSYEEVCSGKTGHYEAVQITYDPSIITYSELLAIFFSNIDPEDASGQFADKGPQYRAAVFYESDTQKRLAEVYLKDVEESGIYKKPLAVKILKAAPFYRAEEYHQNYYRKCPAKYNRYRRSSGRADYLKRMAALKNKMTPAQYSITLEKGAETREK